MVERNLLRLERECGHGGEGKKLEDQCR
jgi:hypothetical protein